MSMPELGRSVEHMSETTPSALPRRRPRADTRGSSAPTSGSPAGFCSPRSSAPRSAPSSGVYGDDTADLTWALAYAVALTAPLAVRRRFPEVVAVVVALAFFTGVSLRIPESTSATSPCSSRCTRSEPGSTTGAARPSCAWSSSSGCSCGFSSRPSSPRPQTPTTGSRASGLFSPFVAFMLIQFLVNAAFFGGAYYMGDRAYASAMERAALQAAHGRTRAGARAHQRPGRGARPRADRTRAARRRRTPRLRHGRSGRRRPRGARSGSRRRAGGAAGRRELRALGPRRPAHAPRDAADLRRHRAERDHRSACPRCPSSSSMRERTGCRRPSPLSASPSSCPISCRSTCTASPRRRSPMLDGTAAGCRGRRPPALRRPRRRTRSDQHRARRLARPAGTRDRRDARAGGGIGRHARSRSPRARRLPRAGPDPGRARRRGHGVSIPAGAGRISEGPSAYSWSTTTRSCARDSG